MRRSIRLGLRAAVAAALAEGVSRLLSLPRSYWAVLVAVVLVNETWGESIEMAAQRFGMTALGCAVGFALSVVVAPHPTVEWALLFVGVFWAVYFRKGPGGGSYPWMIFFISIYVVLLFAVIGRWSLRGIILARVYDTAIGCAVALVASVVVRPRAAADELDAKLRALWASCRELVASPGDPGARALYRDLEDLRAFWHASSYESLSPARRKRDAARVRATEELGQISLGLARALGDAGTRALPPRIREVVAAARARALAAVETIGAPAGGSAAEPFTDLWAALADAAIEPEDLGLAAVIVFRAERVRRWAAELTS